MKRSLWFVFCGIVFSQSYIGLAQYELSFAHAVEGKTPESNQDSLDYVTFGDKTAFIICDGHGVDGAKVSKKVTQLFKDFFYRKDFLKNKFSDSEIVSLFLESTKKATQFSGTTASILIVDPKKGEITLFHSGDSKALLLNPMAQKIKDFFYKGDGTVEIREDLLEVAVDTETTSLGYSHAPNHYEFERYQKADGYARTERKFFDPHEGQIVSIPILDYDTFGRAVFPPMDMNLKTMSKSIVGGEPSDYIGISFGSKGRFLNNARSIEHKSLIKIVSPYPTKSFIELPKDSTEPITLIFASDGIWDIWLDIELSVFVEKNKHLNTEDLTRLLMAETLDRWKRLSYDRDDCSLFIIRLQKQSFFSRYGPYIGLYGVGVTGFLYWMLS